MRGRLGSMERKKGKCGVAALHDAPPHLSAGVDV